MSEIKVIRWLLSFIQPMKGKVFLAVFLGIISNLAVVAIPMIGAYEVLVSINHQKSHPFQALLWMIGCGIIRGVGRYGEQYLNHDIAFRLLAGIRQQIFATLRRLGPGKLVEKKSGDLVTTITTDVEALEVFFAHTISPVLIALGTTLVTVGFLWQYSILLALIVFSGQLLVGIVIPIVGYRQSQMLGDCYQRDFVALNQTVMEDSASLQDIAQYNLRNQQLKKLTEAGQALNNQYKKRLIQESRVKIGGEIVLLTTAVCILIVGVQKQLSLTSVLFGTIISLSSFSPVLALNGLGSALLTTLASARRLYILTQEQPEVDFSLSHNKLKQFDHGSIEKLSFTYHAEMPAVLENLSLEINKGCIVGIGGESGNGKSTLVKLLMRYWDPQKGKIVVNQTNLKEIQEESLHCLEGVMEQTTFIFEDTVANNIGLGKKNATLEEIELAASKAALHEWVLKLPDGYQTLIGNNSRTVSDGERQRIGLARLFLQEAPLLLLDEPTSNLDYLNEQSILGSLTSGIKNQTVVLISHRETTLKIANQQYELVDRHLHKVEQGKLFFE